MNISNMANNEQGHLSKQLTGKARTLWPFGILLAFILFIAGTAGLVVLACSQNTDLVSTDYYEQEIQFQSHLDQLSRARNLDSSASVIYEAATQTIKIALPLTHAQNGIAGKIELYRPSAARLDQQIPLKVDSRGSQFLPAGGLLPGLWKVRVSWNSGEKKYLIEQNVIVGPAKVAAPGSVQNAG